MKRPKRKLRKLEPPPRTKRYCVTCNAVTLWEYNPKVIHSECLECGNRYARKGD